MSPESERVPFDGIRIHALPASRIAVAFSNGEHVLIYEHQGVHSLQEAGRLIAWACGQVPEGYEFSTVETKLLNEGDEP